MSTHENQHSSKRQSTDRISQEGGMLSIQEAEWRARRGADELENAINWIDKTPHQRDDSRHGKLISLFMSLLAERYGISAPPNAINDAD